MSTLNIIDLEEAVELEDAGQIVHIERYVAGAVNESNNSWNGKICPESTPQAVLTQLTQAEPGARFLVSCDETCACQIYFSVWKVVA